MKVAFVLATSTGGTGRHVKMLAAGCAARGLSVQVFGPAQTDRDFGFSASPVRFAPVQIADRPRLLRDLRAIVRLRRLLGADQPDLVHAHGLRAGALSAIAVAFIRPHRRGPDHPAASLALIVTVHNAPPAGGVTGAIYRVLELIVARSASSVLCVSPDLEARMRAAGARRVGRTVVPAPFVSLAAAGVSAETPAVPAAESPAVSAAESPAVSAAGTPAVPAMGTPAVSAVGTSAVPAVGTPAVPTAAARAGNGADSRRPVVLAVGRLAAQKGFGVLLDAAVLWRDIQPAPRLVIAGEGPLEAELKDRAASLGLSVEFAGSRPDVPALLASADVFVLPSAWEGQPLILQEALRAGVPVVATRVGGIPELVGEDAVVLVPPGDARRLADAVRAVLADPALAARLRQAASERAHALPSEDQAVAAALAEYRRVTADRPATT